MDFFNSSKRNASCSQLATRECENATSSSRPKALKRRNRAAISLALSEAAGLPLAEQPEPPHLATTSSKQHSVPGLTLRELEDHRWCISPVLAKERLHEFGLPYEGRRAGLIYSWASIFRAEGLEPEFAKTVTAEERPDLFEHLLDTSAAAALLGYRDASSIRKLVASGQIGPDVYLIFGRRGVYRFRPGALEPLRKASLRGKIV
ncbi:hypothetical protein [Salipiger marinus]|uniref:Uncharacterized protein n=1 Tax=Salipiger marinus TaxID=555512 RepID=A0A1G8VEZ4_9RHOB|nr:hypothetical protein [Salipiger marinus]SDJ63700.1 hypothetical protein SAMN04487993_10881 [Salipiger marinus]